MRVFSRKAQVGADADPYEATHSLLTDLARQVRGLQFGLDEIGVARSLLNAMKDAASYDVAALFATSGEDQLIPLAIAGADRVAWELDPMTGPLSQDTRWDAAVKDAKMTVSKGSFTDPRQGWSAVIPVRLGERVVAVIGVERAKPEWSESELMDAARCAEEFALRMDSCRLFSEIRATATMEERKRLAREIHDGVTQQLTAAAYQLDVAMMDMDETTQRELESTRAAMREIIDDLRFRIWDLRLDIQPDRGLGATLAAMLRDVGAQSGLVVETKLDEATLRLPPDVESGVVRIVQEAVRNVVAHAHASRLTVECRVAPPNLFVRISDDGVGMGPDVSWDSFGLQIMRERAEALGGELEVRPRVGGGTIIELRIRDAATS